MDIDMDIEKLGTKDHPIILTKKITERALLKKHMPTSETPDFARFSKNSEYLHHVLNIIAAKEINADEIKLALFLYELYCFEKISEIELIDITLSIDNQQENPSPKYIYAKSPALEKVKKYLKPKTSFFHMLKKENIILDAPEQIHMYLTKLHDLGLLTLTTVPYGNDIPNVDAKCQGTRYAFIELNRGVINVKINRRWGMQKQEKNQTNSKEKNIGESQSIAGNAKAILKSRKK